MIKVIDIDGEGNVSEHEESSLAEALGVRDKTCYACGHPFPERHGNQTYDRPDCWMCSGCFDDAERIDYLEARRDEYVDDALAGYPEPDRVERSDVYMERSNWAEQNPDDAAELNILKEEYFEEPRGHGGDDPVYRSQMQDAGRGRQLR